MHPLAQTRPEAFHYAWPSLTHGHTLYTINHIDYDLIAHMQNVHARTRMNGIPIYSYSKWGWFYIMFSMLYLWIISGGLFTPRVLLLRGRKKCGGALGERSEGKEGRTLEGRRPGEQKMKKKVWSWGEEGKEDHCFARRDVSPRHTIPAVFTNSRYFAILHSAVSCYYSLPRMKCEREGAGGGGKGGRT